MIKDLSYYISSKFFSPYFTFDEKARITKRYGGFDTAVGEMVRISYYRKRHPFVSKMALRIRDRISQEFRIELFPAIFPIYTNFAAYPEAYRFYMYSHDDVKYYFAAPARFYLIKKNSIVLIKEHGERVFDIETGKRDE